MAFFHTGAPYRRRDSIAPVYIVFKAACFSPQFSFADLESTDINFVHFSAMQFMCSLNESLLSNIIPRYFTLCTLNKGVLLRYISISFCSFRFRLVRSITFDFCSVNHILLSFAHAEILFSSTLAMFSASVIESAFIMITRLSAKATVFIWQVYLRLNKELYVTEPYPMALGIFCQFIILYFRVECHE